MTESETCTNCGAPLGESGALAGRCPRCLLSFGIDDPELVVTRGRQAAAPPSAEELREFFPELEVLELLGAGGMGAVYRAKQVSLDRTVALKVLHGSIAEDPAFEERFHREARALARLSHPGIVAVFASGIAGPYFYLLMEFVDGANLRGVLRSGELAPGEALRVVSQVCDALQYAHREGVVHRDIKPENILITTEGIVKIADFGLAKLVGEGRADVSLTETAQTMGTLHYMAPEQIEHPRTVDHRADLYSLGVVFYELLTGELPLGRFMPPSEKVQVDVRLDEVVLKTLAKEPERRYQAADDIKTDVHRISTTSGTKEGKRGFVARMVAGKGDKVVELGNEAADFEDELEEEAGSHRSRRTRRHDRRDKRRAARSGLGGCLGFALFGIAVFLIGGVVLMLSTAPAVVRLSPTTGTSSSAGVRRAESSPSGVAGEARSGASASASPLAIESAGTGVPAELEEPAEQVAASLKWILLPEDVAAELTLFPEDETWSAWVGQRPVREWPRITDKFSSVLGLDAAQTSEADAILESTFQQYLLHERASVDALDTSPGDVQVRLRPFPEREELIASAHSEMTRLAGSNWRRHGGRELLESLMPFGGDTAAIRIERSETGCFARLEMKDLNQTVQTGPDGLAPPYSRLFEWFRSDAE